MMMQFKSTGYCKISLNDLRYSLALFEKYEATKDLRKWVIETAVNEINEKTPYKVSYELLKTGRKFTHLELKFKQKPLPKKLDSQKEQKAIDIFSDLSDSQIKTYSSILSKLHSISDLADSKDYPAFTVWIANILRNPQSVRKETAKRIFRVLRTETDFKD